MDRIKAMFADTETTGVDPTKHGLTQIAGMIGWISPGLPFEPVRSFDFTLSPFPSDEIVDEALKVQGRTRELIASYPSPGETYRSLMEILANKRGRGEGFVDKFDPTDKMLFLAYNSPFDCAFLRAFWEKNGDNYFGSLFFMPDVCVWRMAMEKMKFYRNTFPDFKLATVAQRLGVTPEGGLFHDALTDIKVTIQLYDKLTAPTTTP